MSSINMRASEICFNNDFCHFIQLRSYLCDIIDIFRYGSHGYVAYELSRAFLDATPS